MVSHLCTPASFFTFGKAVISLHSPTATLPPNPEFSCLPSKWPTWWGLLSLNSKFPGSRLSQLSISVLISTTRGAVMQGGRGWQVPTCVWMYAVEDNSQRDHEVGGSCQRPLLSVLLNIPRMQRIPSRYIFSEQLHFLQRGSDWIWFLPSIWSDWKLVQSSLWVTGLLQSQSASVGSHLSSGSCHQGRRTGFLPDTQPRSLGLY